MSDKYLFNFTPLPKCIVSDHPAPGELDMAKSSGRMLYVLLTMTIPEPRKLDNFIDGYLAGCGVERSEYMAIFFNDTGLPHNEAKAKFIDKYKKLKFPDGIQGSTALAANKSPNLISSFLQPGACLDSTEKA